MHRNRVQINSHRLEMLKHQEDAAGKLRVVLMFYVAGFTSAKRGMLRNIEAAKIRQDMAWARYHRIEAERYGNVLP